MIEHQRSDTGLARRPMAAVFWPVLAPVMFTYLIAALINLATGGWVASQFSEGGSVRGQLIVLILAHLALFAAMSFWAERIGAGPFAGRLSGAADWFALGALTGPVVLILTTALVAGLFAGDDSGWMYREGFDPSLLNVGAGSLLLASYAIILAPLIEEMAFRGIALGCLLGRGWNPAMAAIVTAGAFAATHVHYTLPAMIPVFILGLYLALLRIFSGSIAVPIIAHASANGLVMLVSWMLPS